MSSPKNGGPAFPVREWPSQGGMSLRDWFAGMALAEVPDPASISDAPTTAALAYAIADAMLAERAKTGGA